MAHDCPACGVGIVLPTCDNPKCQEQWIGHRAAVALDARHDAGKCPLGACPRCATWKRPHMNLGSGAAKYGPPDPLPGVAAPVSSETPASDHEQCDPSEGDACTRAFRRGVDSAGRLAAANGIDLREYLNLSAKAEKEIAETLNKRANPASPRPQGDPDHERKP